MSLTTSTVAAAASALLFARFASQGVREFTHFEETLEDSEYNPKPASLLSRCVIRLVPSSDAFFELSATVSTWDNGFCVSYCIGGIEVARCFDFTCDVFDTNNAIELSERLANLVRK